MSYGYVRFGKIKVGGTEEEMLALQSMAMEINSMQPGKERKFKAKQFREMLTSDFIRDNPAKKATYMLNFAKKSGIAEMIEMRTEGVVEIPQDVLESLNDIKNILDKMSVTEMVEFYDEHRELMRDTADYYYLLKNPDKKITQEDGEEKTWSKEKLFRNINSLSIELKKYAKLHNIKV